VIERLRSEPLKVARPLPIRGSTTRYVLSSHDAFSCFSFLCLCVCLRGHGSSISFSWLRSASQNTPGRATALSAMRCMPASFARLLEAPRGQKTGLRVAHVAAEKPRADLERPPGKKRGMRANAFLCERRAKKRNGVPQRARQMRGAEEAS
jgi:hypothetical protein